MSEAVLAKILKEKELFEESSSKSRKDLYKQLEKELGRPVVTFFTSFLKPSAIDLNDVEMLEDVLHSTDLSEGLVLVISSSGGDGLVAERIINVCRSYSGKGDFWVIIPSKAKSAATIISFGSSKIIMGPTSELGPVDPQVRIASAQDGKEQYFSAFNVLNSYKALLEKAVSHKPSEDVRPYLQQLSSFDPREMEEYRMHIELSGDMAVKALKTGMMKSSNEESIKKCITPFLLPEITKTHGRPIYRDATAKCGLKVKKVEANDQLWSFSRELYIRTTYMMSTSNLSKVIESKGAFFAT